MSTSDDAAGTITGGDVSADETAGKVAPPVPLGEPITFSSSAEANSENLS